MKTGVIRVFVGIVIAGFVCAAAYAQDNKIRAAAGDKYVISAKAGGINETDGSVTVRRADGTSGHLIKGDDLNIGDQVWTDTGGKAEVLLNPGSFLRVGPETAFAFTNTSLDDLRLKLATGSAVFEVIADDDFRVTVLMPRTAVALTRSGVYRIDILPDRSSKVSVLKGKIYFGADGKTVIKSGRSATIAVITADVQKFDKSDRDALTVWSKDRAKELAKANASLQRNAMRNTLINSFNRGWNLYDSFGLWVFNPTRRYWCFLPFGSGWGSPYGYYYDFDLWAVRLPPVIYTQPPSGTPTGPRTPPSTTPGTPPSGPPTSTGDNMSRRERNHAPPFMRVQNSGRANGDAAVGGSDGGFRNSGQSAPVYPGSGSAAPSVQPTAAPSAPREPVAPRGIMNRKGTPDN
ncbi:MAG TPA: FecR domain-containing protein [Pyrinomonadaceae bacterium]|nr:FecR domain-containing protein [Pyrinomonadaceae bacterium]